MKGRFSRIFELFNKRNTEYYQKAFDRLEKENKTTFNFAAAFGSFAWLVFRKMYGWAALFTLVCEGGCRIVFMFCKDDVLKWVISLIFYFLCVVLFGFFGNTLYYKDVKSKIAKGYAEMERYNSIDPIGGIILSGAVYWLCAFFLPVLSLKGVTSENTVNLWGIAMGGFFVAIPWAINYKKFHVQESAEPVEVTEESVNAYLEKANPKHLTGPMMVGVLFIMTPLTIVLVSLSLLLLMGFYINTTGNKVAQQQRSDKVVEEVSKTPNNSESGRRAFPE